MICQRNLNGTLRGGFTLLELLISLALLAVLSAALLQSFGLGIRMNGASVDRQEEIDGVALRYQLRRWLIEAGSPVLVSSLPQEFVGTDSAFSFTTLADIHFNERAEGMRVVITASDRHLDISATPLDENGAALGTIEDRIARFEGDARISYFDGLSGEWQLAWDDPNRLPTLVQIELPEGASPQWPPFIVRLLRGS